MEGVPSLLHLSVHLFEFYSVHFETEALQLRLTGTEVQGDIVWKLK